MHCAATCVMPSYSRTTQGLVYFNPIYHRPQARVTSPLHLASLPYCCVAANRRCVPCVRSAAEEMDQVQTMGRTLGFDVVRSEIQRADDIAGAFEALKGRVDALYVVIDCPCSIIYPWGNGSPMKHEAGDFTSVQ